ncbi:DUF1697 domain-containing protein [Streptomyces incanus]
MAELRTLMEGLGHDAVRTHLQSGQAVFTTGSDSPGSKDAGAGTRGEGTPGEGADTAGERAEDALAAELADAIERHFGFAVGVIVRDHAYLRAIVDDCPFPAAELTPKQLHVTYFSAAVGADRFADIDRAAHLPEEFRLGDRALYFYAPDGLGRSKLAERLARPRTTRGVIATTRNWNTVVKLVELTRD